MNYEQALYAISQGAAAKNEPDYDDTFEPISCEECGWYGSDEQAYHCKRCPVGR